MKSLNIQRVSSGSQRGFTIIELVVVILLLGILAATALPRFIDVTDEAHTAVVDGVLGGLGTAGALYRAEFVAQGGSSTPNGFSTLAVSTTTGYPNVDATTDASAQADCLAIFNGMLQGGRPTITEALTNTTNSSTAATNAGEATDFIVGWNSPHCNYTYIADVASGSIGTKFVVWNSLNGEIELK